jgi:hypothetical protein
MTAVSNSSATTPVARLANHSTVEESIPLTFPSIGGRAERPVHGSCEAALKPV